jgi:RimJ/RimL family protein N-acetyltransferase
MYCLARDRVSIRWLQAADLSLMAEWERDPEIAQLMGRRFTTADDVQQWWSTLNRGGNRLGLAILLDGQLIGDMELEHISRGTGDAEVRICIGEKDAWNQGYGTVALERLVHLGFRELGLSRLYLRVTKDNVRAIRCYAHLGFKKRAWLPATGRLRGQPDLVLMDMTVPAHYRPACESAASSGALRTPAE